MTLALALLMAWVVGKEGSSSGTAADETAIESQPSLALDDQGFSWAVASNVEVRRSTLGVSEAGAELLDSYEGRRDCVLVSWGYLDVWGDVWSCVVDGGDWADVCFLEASPGGGCDVRILHIDADDLERAWLQEGRGDG